MRRADHVIWEVTGSRAVLLDPDGTELITLNPVGTLVWDAIDDLPPDAIADLLLPRFEGVTREQFANRRPDVPRRPRRARRHRAR